MAQRNALDAVPRLLRRSLPGQCALSGSVQVRAYSSDSNDNNGSNKNAMPPPPDSQSTYRSQPQQTPAMATPWYGRGSSSTSAPYIAATPPPPSSFDYSKGNLQPRYSSLNSTPSPFARGQRTYPLGASPNDDREKLRALGFFENNGASSGYWSSLLNFPNLGDGDLSSEPVDDYRHAPIPVRLKPVSGKVLHINETFPAMAAFASLNRLCSVEAISPMWRRQKFHERGGLKRKRLKSERWRSRFGAGFSATVQRVQYLARQGW